MASMTDFFEKKVLNTMLGTTAQAPSAVYVALYMSDPTETGTMGTEVAYSGYARQVVSFSSPSTVGSGVKCSNIGDVIFPMPPSAAGTVTYAAIMDSLTGGNMLIYSELNNPISLSAEMTPKFSAGDIVLNMDSGNMSSEFKAKVLNLMRGTNIVGFTPYFAMYNGDPAASGSELSGGGYSRILLSFSNPAEQASGHMQISNTNTGTSSAAESNWGTWSYGAIMDAETSGNIVWYKANTASHNMVPGSRANINAGAISCSVN